jgi:hypothetical protein
MNYYMNYHVEDFALRGYFAHIECKEVCNMVII